MHWTEIEGLRMPRRIGGHPVLDFCNTWAGWGGPEESGGEYLHSYDALVVWTGYAGLLPAPVRSRVRRTARRDKLAAASTLTEVLALRESLYHVLLHPFAREAFDLVADLATRAAANAVLTRHRSGIARWSLPADIGLDLPLLAIAGSAADLLCSPDRLLVRACPGHNCGWLFIDRRGRRRWCSMASCGNRAKVRAHSLRQRSLP